MTFFLKPGLNLKQIWSNAHQAAIEIYRSGGCEVNLKPYKKNKTRQQEKYWHSCLQIVAKEIGEDMEELKAEIKVRCGFCTKKRVGDEMVTIAMSSTRLKVDEYGTLITATKTLAQSLGIHLPEPEFYGMEAA